MATRIQPASSNPYGGAVILNSDPYTQYHLNQRAKEQAKDEALDNYFKNIDSKINPAGMRTQEIPILLQQQNDNRRFYLENKAAIKNPQLDNGKAYTEYMGRNKANMGFIEESKNKAKKYTQMVPIFADPEKRKRMTDGTIQAMAEFDLPMTDPRHKDFDIMSLSYQPKPFDEVKYRAGIKPLVKEVQGTTSYKNAPDYDKTFERIPTIQMLQNFDKGQLSEYAENNYKEDDSYREYIRKLDKDPTQHEKYNKIYKDNFGVDITHPEQFAVAHTLAMVPGSYTKEGDRELDRKAYADYVRRENEKSSLRKIAANKTAQGQSTVTGNLFDTIGSTQKLKAGDKTIDNGVVYDKNNNPFTGEFFITKNFIPSNIYSALKSSGLSDDFLKINQGFTAIVKDGRIQGLKDKYLGLIDRQSMENAQLKFNTEPQKGQQPKFGLPIKNPISKPKKDPLRLF